MKKHLLFLFAALLPMLASAQTKVEIDGIWYNLVSKAKQAEVTFKGDSYDSYFNEYSGSIAIPATVTYNGVAYSVTSIGFAAFYNCYSLTAITIPEGVTSIGDGAFYGCWSLTAINIPEGVTSIGSSAFSGCSSLTAINIPEGVTSIGDFAFCECSSLTAINIPEGVTHIGDVTFYECSSLTAITLPESVTSIGEGAFYYCSSLTAINIPEGVTSIGDYAFSGCSSLTAVHISSIEAWCKISFNDNNSNPLYHAHNLYLNGELVTELVIPEGVTSIGDRAFRGCSSLTSINIPEGVTSIGSSAFSGCSSLTAINIPEGVTSIEIAAFSGCSSLTAITLPESVTSIGKYAFSDCSSLTTIMLPKSVKSIGSKAFANCSELTDVYCNAETVPSTEADAFEGSYIEYATLHVPASAVNEYKNTAPWSSFGTIVSLSPSTAKVEIDGIWYNLVSKAKTAEVTYKGDSYDSYDEYSGSITIPATVTYDGVAYSVTSIGNDAFCVCRSLTDITVPKSLTSIGSHAFSYCISLTAITIPEGVTSIGYQAFYGCFSLTAITIPEGVTSIGHDAFYSCISLTAITCHAVTPPTVGNSDTFYGVDKSIPVYVPEGSVEDYKAAEYWEDFTNITALTPTEVSITINQYGSGTYCSEYALDFSNVEGLKAYAAAGYNSITGVVTLLRLNTSQPGEGLFIKGEPGKYMVPVMESTGDNTLNMLVGTLTETAVNATSADGLYANYKYTIKEGDSQPLFYQFTDGSTLGAGKAYLQIPTAWLPQGEARSIGLRFDEGEGTTDMEQLTIDNSQLTIIYDLYGSKVDNPTKGGIYIVNGKKIVY